MAAPAAAAETSAVFVGCVFRAFAHACGQFGFADIPLDKLLDGVEFSLFLLADEGHGSAGRRGTRRTADAVDIIFGVVRHVVIDDQSDVLDVNAGCC